MTGRIQRFDFGTLRDFRGPVVMQALRPQKEEAVEAPPPPPTFTQEELEAARLTARKQGYAEGFTAGLADAKNKADMVLDQANQSMIGLAEQLNDLSARYAAQMREESQQLGTLVTMIARKVAGDAMNERGEREVIAMVERCLPVIFSKPRLILELHPTLFERALERIETTLRSAGYEGEVQFKPNPALGMSDITLDWQTGSAKRIANELWHEIETLIDRIPLEITFEETLNTTATGV